MKLKISWLTLYSKENKNYKIIATYLSINKKVLMTSVANLHTKKW